MSKVELVISPREKDLGGFFVRRVLPYSARRTVGPFIFFDHMGPATFPPGKGIDVRPHPHIGLATVTYLFEGNIRHRDSLGSDRVIEPGAINWMTAGRGIVHSERMPDDVKQNTNRLNGIQLWVALPDEHEDTTPTFTHHPSNTFPEFKINDVSLKLLLGTALGRTSAVKVFSDMFYLDVVLPRDASLAFPSEGRELAAYVADGKILLENTEVTAYSMAVLRHGEDLELQALEPSRVMLLGGKSVGERHIYWNFVASSKERIEIAKKEWQPGPRAGGRFSTVPKDEVDFIPLPVE